MADARRGRADGMTLASDARRRVTAHTAPVTAAASGVATLARICRRRTDRDREAARRNDELFGCHDEASNRRWGNSPASKGHTRSACFSAARSCPQVVVASCLSQRTLGVRPFIHTQDLAAEIKHVHWRPSRPLWAVLAEGLQSSHSDAHTKDTRSAARPGARDSFRRRQRHVLSRCCRPS